MIESSDPEFVKLPDAFCLNKCANPVKYTSFLVTYQILNWAKPMRVERGIHRDVCVPSPAITPFQPTCWRRVRPYYSESIAKEQSTD